MAEGNWTWPEDSNTLVFHPSRGLHGAPSKKGNTTVASLPSPPPPPVTFIMAAPSSSQSKIQPDQKITLEDVKSVAVGLVSEELLKNMNTKASLLFDQCCRTNQMNSLLWASLLYYDAFIKHKDANLNEKSSIPGVLGEKARESLRITEKEVCHSKVILGHAYSHFILGLEHWNSHHCKGGRSRTSLTHTDQGFFEVLYEYIMMSVWICFGYNNWATIHSELGRIFRTDAYNRDCKLTIRDDLDINLQGFGSLKKGTDEYIAYRVRYERPSVGSLKTIRSPALTNILPFPPVEESGHWKPHIFRKSMEKGVGIIGDYLIDYDLKTLNPLPKSARD